MSEVKCTAVRPAAPWWRGRPDEWLLRPGQRRSAAPSCGPEPVSGCGLSSSASEPPTGSCCWTPAGRRHTKCWCSSVSNTSVLLNEWSYGLIRSGSYEGEQLSQQHAVCGLVLAVFNDQRLQQSKRAAPVTGWMETPPTQTDRVSIETVATFWIYLLKPKKQAILYSGSRPGVGNLRVNSGTQRDNRWHVSNRENYMLKYILM